jgi:hypothetical protein
MAPWGRPPARDRPTVSPSRPGSSGSA